VNGESLDALSMLEVLAEDASAAFQERCSDDERIVKTETIASLKVEGALVERGGGRSAPERYEDSFEKVPGVSRRHGDGQFASDDVQGLLNDLEADCRTGPEAVGDDIPRHGLLCGLGARKEVDEDIGIDEVSAHSSRRG